jgi:hypothetical protein
VGGKGFLYPYSRLAAYYGSAAVRARILEYCGASPRDPGACSAWGIAGYGGVRRVAEEDGAPVAQPRPRLAALLTEGADVCRSLADLGGTLIHLDLDYTNPQDPSEPYRHPERTFARIEPLYRGALRRLGGYGLRPLTLMTARGYHLVIRARRGTALHAALAEAGTLCGSLRARYEGFGLPDAVLMGRAHEAAGRLAEHLAHEVIRDLRGRMAVPVTLADLPPPGGGPFACFDLTAYADPLFARHARCAFSSNQKAWMTGLAPDRPFVISLPRRGDSFEELLGIREDPDAAAQVAADDSASIPDAAPDGLSWLKEYRASRLGRFHRAFDRGPQMEPADWPYSYDSLDLAGFPDCVRFPLDSPNPSLLAPVFLRTVALVLWGLGWQPRSVAGLIRARLEADHAWGDYWRRYDAAARAEFYVRVLCGAAADGLDVPENLTCASQASRGACTRGGCGHDLAGMFPSLPHPTSQPARRARHESLGGRGHA